MIIESTNLDPYDMVSKLLSCSYNYSRWYNAHDDPNDSHLYLLFVLILLNWYTWELQKSSFHLQWKKTFTLHKSRVLQTQKIGELEKRKLLKREVQMGLREISVIGNMCDCVFDDRDLESMEGVKCWFDMRTQSQDILLEQCFVKKQQMRFQSH